MQGKDGARAAWEHLSVRRLASTNGQQHALMATIEKPQRGWDSSLQGDQRARHKLPDVSQP